MLPKVQKEYNCIEESDRVLAISGFSQNMGRGDPDALCFKSEQEAISLGCRPSKL